jgi:hypothetical protein
MHGMTTDTPHILGKARIFAKFPLDEGLLFMA